MKSENIIVLGLAAMAVYFIVKNKPATAKGATSYDVVNEVLDSAGKAFSNGWHYYTDGTAIDPSGNYYTKGELVYTAPAR